MTNIKYESEALSASTQAVLNSNPGELLDAMNELKAAIREHFSAQGVCESDIDVASQLSIDIVICAVLDKLRIQVALMADLLETLGNEVHKPGGVPFAGEDQ